MMASESCHQSSKLIHGAVVAESTVPEDDPEFDLISQEQSCSDWHESPGKTVKRARPLAKKAKTDTPSIPTRGCKKADLSRLPSMPLDILFEIFSLLTPTDLLSLTHTCSLLRETLMTRKAVTVCSAAARDQIQDGPRCPQDMSEPAWANLVFGGSTCQVCGALDVGHVSFSLRRRVCAFCLKINLVHSGKVSKRFPALDPLVMDLIPYTDARGLSCTEGSESKFFWRADIEDMARMLRWYQKDIQIQKVGAVQALEDFTQAKIQSVKDMTTYAHECEERLDNAILQRSASTQFQKNVRLHTIKARFLELGYVERDMEHLRSHREVNSATQLTDQIWNRIRPILEPRIQQKENDRLLLEQPYLCLECPSGNARVFILPGVRDHLKSKHGIRKIRRGIHFKVVPT